MVMATCSSPLRHRRRCSGKRTLAFTSRLLQALDISSVIEDASGDVDTLGMIADVYVEMGELEKAAKIYDDVLFAIQNEEETSALSSTWDC